MTMTANTRAKKKMTTHDDGDRTRLLVVEDETDLQDLLRYNLTREGFAVTCTASGEEALRLVQQQQPDMVLLDLMLPGIDGLEVCRQLKSGGDTSSIPIVMLTAKGEEADIVIGLEIGADDYITKPFSPRVLIARLKAVLRRPVMTTEGVESEEQPTIRTKNLDIIPERHEVKIGDKHISLTATEFRLLYLLARRPGRVFTRQQIIDTLHEGYAAVTDRSVDVQVVSLRRKLGPAGKEIETVRGVGYRLKD